MYIYLYFHSYLCFIFISPCRHVCLHTCVPWHPCRSQKTWCLDASPQSSTQAFGGGFWITKDRFISSLKRKFLMTADYTLHQLLSAPFSTLGWQWVWSVIWRKPTKPSVHYFKSLVRVWVYVWHMWERVHVRKYPYMWVCVCPSNSSFIHQLQSTSFLETVSLLIPGAFLLGWDDWPESSRDLFVSVSPAFRSWCCVANTPPTELSPRLPSLFLNSFLKNVFFPFWLVY